MRYTFSAPGTQIPMVRVYRGATGPKIASGFAKITVTDRPKRMGVTTYNGTDPIMLSIPILFDGWKNDNPVEDEIRNLMSMSHEIDGEPPAVRINVGIAGGLPIEPTGIDWLISNIAWGDDQIWDFQDNGSLVRFRQDAVVQAVQKVDPEVVAFGQKMPGNTRGGKKGKGGGKHPSTYVVKAGDTFPKIAIAIFHNRNRWREIAKLNRVTDPRAVKAGNTIKLPK